VVLAMFKAVVSTTIAEISVSAALAVFIVAAVGATGGETSRFGDLLRRVLEVAGSGVWEVWIDSRRTLVANGGPAPIWVPYPAGCECAVPPFR